MNIEGLSVKTIEQLYEKFNTSSFSDIYNLNQDMLSQLDGFKDKKISNILSSINKSKTVNLSNFIFALGIGNIGIKTAKQLAKHYKNIQNLQKATIEELIALDDIAEITATEIHHYFHDKENIEELDNLLNHIKIKEETETQYTNNYFSGKKVVLTGTLANFTRQNAEIIIEQLGGTTSSSVTSQTDIVLVGENPGSKFDKAKKLGIQVMFEDEFMSKIKK